MRLRDILAVVVAMPLAILFWFWLMQPLIGPGQYEAMREAVTDGP